MSTNGVSLPNGEDEFDTVFVTASGEERLSSLNDSPHRAPRYGEKAQRLDSHCISGSAALTQDAPHSTRTDRCVVTSPT
jgi:hypothetical protein